MKRTYRTWAEIGRRLGVSAHSARRYANEKGLPADRSGWAEITELEILKWTAEADLTAKQRVKILLPVVEAARDFAACAGREELAEKLGKVLECAPVERRR